MTLAQQKSGAAGLSYLLLLHLSLEEWLPTFQAAQIDNAKLMSMTESCEFEKMGIPADDSCRLSSYIRCLHRKAQGCMNNEDTVKLALHCLEFVLTEQQPFALNNTRGVTLQEESDSVLATSLWSKASPEENCRPDNRGSLRCMPAVNSVTGAVNFAPITPPPRPMSMPVPLTTPLVLSSPPPDYPHDNIFRRLERCHSCILPCEDEMREELPPYQCTVYKIGFAYVKREMETPSIKSRWRSWGKLYLELWGTILHVYRTPPTKRHGITGGWLTTWASWTQANPMETLNLAGADASLALDYTKRTNTLRLTTAHGPRLLIQLLNKADLVSWVEHLQAAINIALDLEQRPMPKFVTLPGRGLTASLRTARAIEIERLRDQRRRDQPEMLI